MQRRFLLGACICALALITTATTSTHGASSLYPAAAATVSASSPPSTLSRYAATMQHALHLIQESQINVTTTFQPPFQQQKLAGVYPSYIHFNQVGDPINQMLRNVFGVFDNNQFVTNWLLYMTLEATKYGAIDLDDEWFLSGMNFTLGFREKDDPAAAGTQDFWMEVLRNGSWTQFPYNTAGPIILFQPIAAALQKWCDATPSICPTVEPIVQWAHSLNRLLDAFGIPADSDDTGVTLAIGSLLQQVGAEVPDTWELFFSQESNRDPTPVMAQFTKYCYQPFSDNIDQNSIDPRTYWWIREFIANQTAEKRASGNDDPLSLMLLTTWLDNVTSSEATYFQHHKMPFFANNVDGSVVGNAVFGILNSIFRFSPISEAPGPVNYTAFTTPELLQLLQDSSKLLAWIVDTEILLERSDIVLLYYPQHANFYYFAARSLHLLQSTPITQIYGDQYWNDTVTMQTLLDVQSTLTNSLQGQGTQTLIQQSQTSVSSKSGLNVTYWDEFLGQADTDAQNRSTPHYDDRLFATSININAIIDMWTLESPGTGGSAVPYTLSWMPNVPSNVLTLLSQACTFLNEELLAGDYHPENTFFSGSAKGPTTLPWNYPITDFRFLNGTVIPWQNVSWNVLTAEIGVTVSGVISEEEYQYMIDHNPLDLQPPYVFAGYNVDGEGMVYWSSPPLTYAAGTLAMGKCGVLNL